MTDDSILAAALRIRDSGTRAERTASGCTSTPAGWPGELDLWVVRRVPKAKS